MSQIQTKEAHTSSESISRLPEVQKNLMETLLNQNLSEVGTPVAAHGFMYQNTEVIREMLYMLNSICGQAAALSPTVGRPGDRKSAPSYIEAKPINLTRNQTPNYDSDLLFPPASTKGQFVCPNCGQDFLNRDALAMHMMESVHSEACAGTNNGAGCSKEDRNAKSINCHHLKIPSINQPTTSTRRYIRLPIPSNSGNAQFDTIFQSIIKTTSPTLDAGVPRPGRKPRRLIPIVTGADRGGPERAEDICRNPLSLKRPKSCEPKVENRTQDQPDRASSTPGGVHTVKISNTVDSSNDLNNIYRNKKIEIGEPEIHRRHKVVITDPPIEKRARTAVIDDDETSATVRKGERIGAGSSGGTSNQWLPSDSTPSDIAVGTPYPFVCRHCAIGFSDQTLFNLHMGLHTSFNPWQCNMCSKEFSNVYEFTAHALHY
nr:zinc finger C2H2 type [Hymenolepis microstoma]